MVFPGAALDGPSIYGLLENEGVTFAAGVPTIWKALLDHVGEKKGKFATLNRTIIGGAAAPPQMISTFGELYGVEVLHAWGMTEMSPLGTICTLKRKHLSLSPADKLKIRR